MYRLMILVGLLLSQVAWSNEDKGLLAQALFEAEEWERAREAYQQLLETPLTEKQQWRTRYNLGNSCLALGEWEAALSHYDKAMAAGEQEPLVQQRAAINRAYALVYGSCRVAENLECNEENFISQCRKGLELLEEAEQACVFAEQCQEEDEINLEGLKRSIKAEVRQWLERIEAYHHHRRPYEQLIAELTTSLAREAERVENLAVAKVVAEQALPGLGKFQQKYEPYWEALKSRTESLHVDEVRVAEELRGAPFESLREANQDPLVAHSTARQAKLQEAYDHFCCSRDYLTEQQGWRGYEEQLIALLHLHELAWQEQGGKGLDPVLEERLQLCERLADLEAGEQQAALERIDDQYLAVAQRLCQEEERENGLTAQLLDQLLVRLEGGSTRQSDQACRDLWFYRQIESPEEESLVELRSELAAGRQLPHMHARVDAVRDKIDARVRMCEENEESARLAEVSMPLDEASALIARGEISDNRQLIQLIEVALCAWSPSAWLQVHLEEWQQRCGEALANDCVTESFLSGLVCDQEAVLEKLQERDLIEGKLGTNLDAAVSDIRLARLQLNENRSSCAHFCVEDAQRALNWASQSLSKQRSLKAAALLERGIEEQRFARDLTGRAAQEARRQPLEPAVVEVLCGAQDRVLDSVLEFPKALLLMAQEQFADEEEMSDCLKQEPYRTIMRYYEEGFNEGMAVARHLTLKRPEWHQADLRQEAVLEQWEEALKRLDDPSQDDGSGDGPPDGEGGNEMTQEMDHNQQQQQTAAAMPPTELFELLQQMDREDRPDSNEQVVVKKGIRPW